MSSIEEELTSDSIQYISQVPLEKRKKLGQYMTPRSIREIAIANLPLNDGDKILDPAVGTGELLLSVQKANPKTELFGWDIDPDILEIARKNLGPEATLIHQSGLEVEDKNGFFDGAIINPPYFELKPSEKEKAAFGDIIKGRANIYAFFIKKTIELVKDEGYMAFIVPPSMNNGGYFSALRKYILDNTEVKFVRVISDSSLFIEAQTSVQIIVLQKKKKPVLNDTYVLDLHSLCGSPVQRYIFTEKAEMIRKMWKDKTSLYNLGYDVITGPLVWNVYKPNLSSAEINDDYLPVYYSKDISLLGKVAFNKGMDARRYMDSTVKAPLEGKALIVNRIVGGVGVGTIRAAIVEGKYFAENHVNVVVPRKDAKQLITLEELHAKLTTNTHIGEYLQAFTGNTQLSGSELKYFIPVSSE